MTICYLAAAGAGVAFFFLPCFLPVAAGLVAGAAAAGAAVSAAIGAAVFGISAAIAPAAIPMDNKAEVIKVPDLFMGTPGRWYLQALRRIRRIREIQPR